MNCRQRSKLYGKWAFVKYPSDLMIYAVCQNCCFTYPCSKKSDMKYVPDLDNVYRYCLQCGLKMSLFNGEEVYKIS